MIEVFKAHDVGYFLYNGGNDSMDTANKIALLAQEKGLDLAGVGVPKTIDNDVGDSEFKLIDHTPGYGSTAKYWMHMVQTRTKRTRALAPPIRYWSCRRWAGRSASFPRQHVWPIPIARCRCKSIWRKAPAR